MKLDGIPISEEQCIGESLPILNNSFETLSSFTVESRDLISLLNVKVNEAVTTVQQIQPLRNSKLNTNSEGNVGIGKLPTYPNVFHVEGPCQLSGTVTTENLNVSRQATIKEKLITHNGATIGLSASQNSLMTAYPNAKNNAVLYVQGTTLLGNNVGINVPISTNYSLNVGGSSRFEGATFNTISASNYLGLNAASLSLNTITELDVTGDLKVTTNTGSIGYEIPGSSVALASLEGYGPFQFYYVTINSPCGVIKLPPGANFSSPRPLIITNSQISSNDVIIVNMKQCALNYSRAEVVKVYDGGFRLLLSGMIQQNQDSLTPGFDAGVQIEISFAKINIR